MKARPDMPEPINLNKARKAKTRAAKATKANENRLKFGQTKAKRTLAQAEQTKFRNHLESTKLHKPEEPDS